MGKEPQEMSLIDRVKSYASSVAVWRTPWLKLLMADVIDALSAQEWRDISTAPKDGTAILIGGTNSKSEFFMADAIWDSGWMLFHPDEDGYTAECFQASHWHPLPAAPVAVIAEERGE